MSDKSKTVEVKREILEMFILVHIGEHRGIDATDIADHFGISYRDAFEIIDDLAERGLVGAVAEEPKQ